MVAQATIKDMRGSESSLRKELAGRQQALSSAMERCVSQESLLGEARSALQLGPAGERPRDGGGRLGNGAQRDGWLGEGRSLGVGPCCFAPSPPCHADFAQVANGFCM